ncbi:hypothetical protein [Pseudooceanicola sp. LIPI14-2-Ac024]|uniref:hypothetical protein n=1 Tax=Pseudooceanicola sp. LIPI14-2-Ac024 TaxID=3344875 RepID=UPI0035CED201
MLIWTVQPATSHVPAVLDVLSPHAQMIRDHGHSHGLEEDPAWAMHGHTGDEGEIVASYDDDHSGVWRNRDSGDVSFTVQVRGEYGDFRKAT